MVSLQRPIFCHAVPVRRVGVWSVSANSSVVNARMLKSEARGFKGFPWLKAKVGNLTTIQPRLRRRTSVPRAFSSSSDGNGSTAENSNENNEDYVNSSVIEAVEVRSGPSGFMIRMRDGSHLRCVHNSPQSGQVPDYAPHPAIVLKMDDKSSLLLPIIVLEAPSLMLMAALQKVEHVRPTMYEVIKDMIENMGYGVKLVRITKRLQEAYFAQVFISKVGNEAECLSFDLRPSDAINIAVRCQAPIQVNRFLVYSDGMRVIESGRLSTQGPASDLFSELDRPTDNPCVETREFDLLRNMLIAAVEERYSDAAQWRDKLSQFRANRNWA